MGQSAMAAALVTWPNENEMSVSASSDAAGQSIWTAHVKNRLQSMTIVWTEIRLDGQRSDRLLF
jgi:hypothetical protein